MDGATESQCNVVDTYCRSAATRSW